MQIPAVVRHAVAVASFAAVVVAQREDPAPGGTRVYEVRDLVQHQRVYLPASVAEAAFESPISDEAWPAIDLGELAELVKMATGMTYWEQEGVDLRPEDSGLLVLTCDEQMHASVRDVLAKVRHMLFDPLVVEVHELPGAAIADHGAVLSAAEAEALLGKVGEHRVHVGRVDPQQPLLLESKRIRSRLAGMHMKVAQQAAIPDLAVTNEVYGASWQVRVRHTVGGELLVTVSGSDRAQQEGAVCELPNGVDGGVAALELAATRIATAHASAYLRHGQALLLGADAPGAVALCVRASPASGQAPTSFEIGGMTVYPVASLVGGPDVPEDVRVPYEDTTLYPEGDREPMPAVFDDGRLIEWLCSQVAPDTWDGSPNLISYVSGRLIVIAADDVQKQIAANLRQLQRIDNRQFSLEVAFGQIPAGTSLAASMTPEGTAALAAALPRRCVGVVSASRIARVSATSHEPYVKDYDVAIASGSAVTSPVIGSYASGFVMQASAVPMDQGLVRLDLRLAVMGREGERQVFDLRDPRFAGVGRVDVRENEVGGGVVVGVGEWTLLRVGPLEGGAGTCAVVARVTVAR
ncbi:MAG: hypothetical protein R3F29_03420 [Planctomycetota bacterium]